LIKRNLYFLTDHFLLGNIQIPVGSGSGMIFCRIRILLKVSDPA
jgi:hypothetical protein